MSEDGRLVMTPGALLPPLLRSRVIQMSSGRLVHQRASSSLPWAILAKHLPNAEARIEYWRQSVAARRCFSVPTRLSKREIWLL